MTIEQVEKHKEVIKWFVDNPTKGVWKKKTPYSEWHIDNTPNWCKDYFYVQNDKYAEFRKALVDGKELQYTEDDGKTWSTHYRKLDTWFNTKNIRIKPEEPEFKVGDWVQRKGYSIIIQINAIDATYVHSSTSEHYRIDNVELWKPKYTELCVFWDNNCNEYYIGRYGALCFKETFGDEFDNHYRYLQQKGDWDNIAPLEFVQTLKAKHEKY